MLTCLVGYLKTAPEVSGPRFALLYRTPAVSSASQSELLLRAALSLVHSNHPAGCLPPSLVQNATWLQMLCRQILEPVFFFLSPSYECQQKDLLSAFYFGESASNFVTLCVLGTPSY